MSRPFLQRALACFMLLGALCIAPAHALTSYCVGTTAEFTLALDRAETDNDDSRINLRSGVYTFSDNYYYNPPKTGRIREGKLIIDGGYGSFCATRTNDARSTVLRGDGHQTIFFYPWRDSLNVKTLSFDGVSAAAFGPSLGDTCPATGQTVVFERLRMETGMLRFIGKCHDLTLRDSLLVNGYASDFHYPYGTALDISLDQETDTPDPATATIINTTVAEGRTGIYSCCARLGTAYIYNSIFRREGTDIYSRVNIYARNHRYDRIDFVPGSLIGQILIGSARNVSVDPDLDSNYRPNPGSPMVDTGTADVPDTLPSIDLFAG
ncbi:MAG: hypothetical protein ACREPX_02575, partial [Rhodanobacteraceae bacterium]